ncbi:MAG TPA: BTAD domain-containing putative transcriptional regulator [Syntrophobacteria bacterium]|nr:BTAD domain-containing putative transcriptional regulator [Syntrophobacteria bacterium]
MGTLRLRLFGNLRISHDGQPPIEHVTRAVQSLLAYLLIHRQRLHPREVLASVFWGEQSDERARGCLSTALWRLRGVLETNGVPKGTYLISTPMGEVGFNRGSDHWLDVAVFEEKVGPVLGKRSQEMEAEDAEALQDALSLCTSELLEGFYDDWALRERERLRSLHLRGLAHLMRYRRDTGAYEESLACGRQILDLDPLSEEIHREMMRLYVEVGQRALAVRQYEACSRMLDEELGIVPLEETQTLYREIVQAAGGRQPRGAIHRVEPRRTVGEIAGLEVVLERLQLALQSFEKMHQQIQRAAQILERLLPGRSLDRGK